MGKQDIWAEVITYLRNSKRDPQKVLKLLKGNQKGKETSTNSIASIFAWSQGLSYRASFDNNEDLKKFSSDLENACIKTVEDGFMTKELALLVGMNQKWMETKEFINKIADTLKSLRS